MRTHSWPGNVRELQNRVKRALVLSDSPVIGPAELELKGGEEGGYGPASLKEARQVLEKEIVAKALQESNGNISKTARSLGISRPTLYQLLERYGLK